MSLAAQGIDNNEIAGLAFDAAGKLLVASTQCMVYRVHLGYDPAVRTATLTQVSAAATDGVAANAGQVSTNVGQVIELRGTNFGANTQVLFNNNGSLAGATGLVYISSSENIGMGISAPTLVPT